ncbi:thymidylate synthase [Entomoplasma freundtii]|uniref:Thymidylate synthase n=1 Tax=Entomoplasma freundtii TaxID=74700 RepID=A0A2K8NUQ1_9MOLU|nr:thymidylate synthase [Entomoplasma freundtii]ATZ16491.1 thymidylate synthase [Entomoplasma freundtii]TDY56020.1 thymidylate synthase [Entomoplasma freundtii]
MKQYLNLMEKILTEGELRNNRTGIDTISVFGLQAKYDLQQGFPLVTTKKVFFKGVVHELLWFLAGDTNIQYLVKNNVRIWNEWAFERYKKTDFYHGESQLEYIEKIKNDDQFAAQFGDLGPIYGHQWRNSNGVDQLKEVIAGIKNNPNSRRLIVDCWNPQEISEMALPPCHTFFQFYVSNNGQTLNLQLYQRSADMFLGVPFNIASYSLLLQLVAQECGLEAGTFVHTIGDGHIYVNHLDQVKLQLTRPPYPLSKITIKPFASIFDVKFEDIELVDYQSHPLIKGMVAV